MFEIHPNCLYCKRDLEAGLSGICDADRLLKRIQPRSVIRGVYLGRHLLDAIAAAEDFRDRDRGRTRAKMERAKSRPKRSQPSTPEPALIGKAEVQT